MKNGYEGYMTGKYRSDRELVTICQSGEPGKPETIRAYHELWEKYGALRTTMKHSLRAFCKDNGLPCRDILTDWDCSAYEKFVNQMPGMDLKRVEHHKNWTLHIRLYGYWTSMNRDIVKRMMMEAKREVTNFDIFFKKSKKADKDDVCEDFGVLDLASFMNGWRNIEEQVETQQAKDILWEAVARFDLTLDEKDVKLLNMNFAGYSQREVMETLGLNRHSLPEKLAGLKEGLSGYITEVGKEHGLDIDYSYMEKMFLSGAVPIKRVRKAEKPEKKPVGKKRGRPKKA